MSLDAKLLIHCKFKRKLKCFAIITLAASKILIGFLQDFHYYIKDKEKLAEILQQSFLTKIEFKKK